MTNFEVVGRSEITNKIKIYLNADFFFNSNFRKSDDTIQTTEEDEKLAEKEGN